MFVFGSGSMNLHGIVVVSNHTFNARLIAVGNPIKPAH